MGATNLVVILVTVFMSACAQLMLKLGASAALPAGPSSPQGILETLMRVLLSPMIIGGIFIYGISVLVWIWVLSRVELSVAYPFVGLSFIFTLVFGVGFLGEAISIAKVAGTLLIIVGCVLVANSTP